MLTPISTAQARTKCGFVVLACGILPNYKIQHKLALLTCPCAFRLRSLAQTGVTLLGPGACHFSYKFSHKLALAASMCISTALPRTNGRHAPEPRHFSFKFLHKRVSVAMCISIAQACTSMWRSLGLRHFARQFPTLTCISTAQARAKCGSRFWSAAFYS